MELRIRSGQCLQHDSVRLYRNPVRKIRPAAGEMPAEDCLARPDRAAIAAYESSRITKLYDRTGDEIALDEVERITI